jgi:hypothetical protein
MSLPHDMKGAGMAQGGKCINQYLEVVRRAGALGIGTHSTASRISEVTRLICLLLSHLLHHV